MKNIQFFFLLLFLISCDKKIEEKKVDNISKENLSMNEQNKINCSNAEKKAIKDLKNNKLIYIKYLGMYGYLRSEKEFREILTKYKIGFKIGEVESCLSHVSNGEFCYAQIMEKEIIKKHGIKFLDSIKNCADKQFVINNPNQIFSIEECDEAKTYPNPKKSEDFWDIPSKEFNAKFTYPKNYVECKKEYDNIMDAKFILYKNGAIDSLKIETEFTNPKNNEFKNYIEAKVKEYIEKKKWIPLKRFGITINSEIKLTFDIK